MTIRNRAAVLATLFVVGWIQSQDLLAQSANPLDPDAKPGRPSREIKERPGTPYVDSQNPRDPSYRAKNFLTARQFNGTSRTSSQPYQDRTNPLDPAYKRP